MKSFVFSMFRSFVSLWALKNLAELSNRPAPAVCMRWQGQDVYFVLYQLSISIAVQVIPIFCSKIWLAKNKLMTHTHVFWIIALVSSVDFCYLVCIYCTEYFNEFHMIML